MPKPSPCLDRLLCAARLRAKPPLLRIDLERRLALFFAYYVCLRPHRALGGATPAEVFLGRRPAHHDAIPPPRGRPGEHVRVPKALGLRYLDSQQQLPYIVLRAA